MKRACLGVAYAVLPIQARLQLQHGLPSWWSASPELHSAGAECTRPCACISSLGGSNLTSAACCRAGAPSAVPALLQACLLSQAAGRSSSAHADLLLVCLQQSADPGDALAQLLRQLVLPGAGAELLCCRPFPCDACELTFAAHCGG